MVFKCLVVNKQITSDRCHMIFQHVNLQQIPLVISVRTIDAEHQHIIA